MAISFSDTVSAAVELTSGAVRADSQSNGQLQAATTSDECGLCPTEKSRRATDEDFDSVLAAILSGIGTQFQPTPVADKTETTTTAVAGDSGVTEMAASFGFGHGVAQAGMAKSPSKSAGIASALPSVDSQNATHTRNVPASLVEGESVNSESPTTDIVADASLNGSELLSRGKSANGVSAPVRTESVPESSSPEALSGVAKGNSKIQAASTYSVVASESESWVTPEALSQDAIDALERIGRSSVSATPETSKSTFPETAVLEASRSTYSETVSTESTLPVFDSTTLTMPVPRLPDKPVQKMSELRNLESEASVSVSLSSVLSESKQLKVPATVVAQSVADQTASSPILASPSEYSLPATIVSAMSVSASEQPGTPTVTVTTPGSTATENRTPSVANLPTPELNLDAKSAVRPSSIPTGVQDVELAIKPARIRTPSTSVPSGADTAGFRAVRELHAAAATSSDVVRGDVVQLNVANAFSEVATSVSSEVRQPLSSQVSQAIMEHIERSGVRSNDSLTVRLDPPELGEMKIELSKTVDGLAVRVTAREAVTMDMLFARGQEIETQLRGQHMNLKSLEFLRGDMSGNTFSQGQQQQNAESRTSEKFMNQVRRGSRSSSPVNANAGRIATPESAYGLSFRA